MRGIIVKLIIRGVSSNSGFGQATVGLLKTAQRSGIDTKFIAINAHRQQHRAGFDESTLSWLDSITIDPYKNDTSDAVLIDVGSLVFGLSIPSIPCIKKILYTTYETVKIHSDYVNMMNNKYDEIWTASNFNKVSFMSSGVTKPVKIIPHYIDPELINPDAAPMKIKNKRGFTFAYNADLSFRKGLHYLLPAFCEEFKEDEDVSLLLKLTMSDTSSAIAPNIVESLNRLMLGANVLEKPRAPILLMVQYLDYSKLSSFYSSIDCYVAPYMGEGFCYPIAEAMLCNKPIIASRCAAPIDYLDNSCSWLVNLDAKNPTIPITDPWQLKIDPKYEGQSLYHIDVKDLRKKMREAFDNRELTTSKASKAREKIVNYTNINRLSEILKDLI
jgi:glycosyltransferase involved in cell wall biosynthesis